MNKKERCVLGTQSTQGLFFEKIFFQFFSKFSKKQNENFLENGENFEKIFPQE